MARCGYDRSVEGAYYSAAPDPTFAFVGRPCCPKLDFSCSFWIVITFCTMLATLHVCCTNIIKRHHALSVFFLFRAVKCASWVIHVSNSMTDIFVISFGPWFKSLKTLKVEFSNVHILANFVRQCTLHLLQCSIFTEVADVNICLKSISKSN
jgi:hypothetical protein